MILGKGIAEGGRILVEVVSFPVNGDMTRDKNFTGITTEGVIFPVSGGIMRDKNSTETTTGNRPVSADTTGNHGTNRGMAEHVAIAGTDAGMRQETIAVRETVIITGKEIILKDGSQEITQETQMVSEE